MYESKRQRRKKGTEYLVEKLNALNLERSKDGKNYPKYRVVNFTLKWKSVIMLLIGLGLMALVAVIIGIVPPLAGGWLGVLSLVLVICLIVCAVLSMVFAVVFFCAWLNPAEDVVEIGFSDKEMHFLADKIAEAQRAESSLG